MVLWVRRSTANSMLVMDQRLDSWPGFLLSTLVLTFPWRLSSLIAPHWKKEHNLVRFYQKKSPSAASPLALSPARHASNIQSSKFQEFPCPTMSPFEVLSHLMVCNNLFEAQGVHQQVLGLPSKQAPVTFWPKLQAPTSLKCSGTRYTYEQPYSNINCKTPLGLRSRWPFLCNHLLQVSLSLHPR